MRLIQLLADAFVAGQVRILLILNALTAGTLRYPLRRQQVLTRLVERNLLASELVSGLFHAQLSGTHVTIVLTVMVIGRLRLVDIALRVYCRRLGIDHELRLVHEAAARCLVHRLRLLCRARILIFLLLLRLSGELDVARRLGIHRGARIKLRHGKVL